MFQKIRSDHPLEIMSFQSPQRIPTASLSITERLRQQIAVRRQAGTLRSLSVINNSSDKKEGSSIDKGKSLIDFASNDYLGLAHCQQQASRVHEEYARLILHDPSEKDRRALGATGSRLLSGDSDIVRQLEQWLAKLHNSNAALLCNSGYDANLSVLSSIPTQSDCVVYDELCHNSIIMGLRMGRTTLKNMHAFRHNDVNHLQEILDKIINEATPNGSDGGIFVVVESVYSMEGDIAPLQSICDLLLKPKFHPKASLIVDEAHGLGVYGKTNITDLTLNYDEWHTNKLSEEKFGGTGVLAALELEKHPSLLCAVFTFGKAAGCHGAVIVSQHQVVVDYLINYARPFIYSTALPPHSIITIQCAYNTLISEEGQARRMKVFTLVRLFRDSMFHHSEIRHLLLPSASPIQSILVPSNHACIKLAKLLKNNYQLDVYAIRSPTVPKGKERIRIILHSYNTRAHIRQLVRALQKEISFVPPVLRSGL